MYFDAVVVEVNTFFTFIPIGSGHTVKLNDLVCSVNNTKNKVISKLLRKDCPLVQVL